MHFERRRFIRTSTGAGSLLLLPSLSQAAVEAVAPGARSFPLLDLTYAGYLISGVGSTPLASARLIATQQGNKYQIELRVESFLADLTYKSNGVINAQGLKPLEYQEKRKVAFRREREKSVRYIHTADPAIQNTQAGDQLYVPTGSQDRLSLILQVIWLAQQRQDFLTDDKQISLPFARVNRVADSLWHIGGPAPLQRSETDQPGALSSQHGYQVTRVADEKDTVDVVFWLSAAQPRLPLVLQFSEKGRSLRFVHDSV